MPGNKILQLKRNFRLYFQCVKDTGPPTAKSSISCYTADCNISSPTKALEAFWTMPALHLGGESIYRHVSGSLAFSSVEGCLFFKIEKQATKIAPLEQN